MLLILTFNRKQLLKKHFIFLKLKICLKDHRVVGLYSSCKTLKYIHWKHVLFILLLSMVPKNYLTVLSGLKYKVMR